MMMGCKKFSVLIMICMVFFALQGTGCSAAKFGEDLGHAMVTEGVDVRDVIKEHAESGFNEFANGTGTNNATTDGEETASLDAESTSDLNESTLEEITESSFVYCNGKMEVHYIDVGQGDATLILCDGEAMLIDAGDNNCGTRVQNYIFKQGVGELKLVVGTHYDADHIGGLDVIITKFPCGTVLLPDYEKSTVSSRDVKDAIAYKGYKITNPSPGDNYSLGSASVTVIGPVSYEGDEEESNNYSIAVKVVHGENTYLFMGDAEELEEQQILSNGTDLKADVLKLGHHGSKTSTSQDFLNAVDPSFAVISCMEKNDYGHPHQSVLNKLRKKGILVFRTDEQGSIISYSDGSNITWNCAPSETWQSGFDK